MTWDSRRGEEDIEMLGRIIYQAFSSNYIPKAVSPNSGVSVKCNLYANCKTWLQQASICVHFVLD